MNLFKRKNLSLDQPHADQQPVDPSTDGTADLGYRRLEQRQVLSASFIAGASGLFLDSFDLGQDLTFGQETTSVNGTLQESYLFVLETGSWSGSDADPLVELESVNGGVDNRLEVATAFFNGASNANIEIDGMASGGNVEFNQSSSFLTFDSLRISNFTNMDRTFQIVSNGDVEVGNISVLDSNPADTIVPSAQIQIDTFGSITTTGTLENLIENDFDDIVLIASGQDNDITVGSRIETAAGVISIRADDSILFGSSAEVIATGIGNVQIESGLGLLPGDTGDEIRMEEGSSIDSNLGKLNLLSEGDVFLGSLNSDAANEAVFVFSGGQIVDHSTSELDNAIASNGRVRLFAQGDIGTADDGDIDVQAKTLQFDSNEGVFISDSDLGVTIDRFSRAGGTAQIHSSHFLEISRGVDVGESSRFSSGSSAIENDDLIINRSATVTLNSSVDSQLEFISGDDIVFDSGSIVSTGGGLHSVVLVADAEGTLDNDRGSISNTAGGNASVTTDALEATAFAGIGDLNDAPLRINVDQLVASNHGPNDIRISEANSIELVDVQTNDGSINVFANNDIEVTQVVSGETETLEDNDDDIEIVSATGTINVSLVNSADDLLLNARSMSITDNPNSQILVNGNAVFNATHQITLADNPGDMLRVEGNASFSSTTVDVGHDLQSAGNPTSANTFLGSLTLVATDAFVVEDDATQFSGTSRVRDLYLASANDITNSEDAALTVFGQAQLNSPDQIVLGNQVGDQFNIAHLGLVAPNVHLETDAPLVIDGTAPNQTPNLFGMESTRGTEVTETLFVKSTGSVTQTDGVLNARSIGIQADGHVHLSRIIEHNDSISISAGTAGGLTDVDMIQELRDLDQIENSEVRSGLPQSIAIKHQSALNITTVASHLGTDSVSGLQTSEGGIFASAVGEINLIENVEASSSTADPQVTVYSEAGSAKRPAINFAGGIIQVNGPSNEGVVNANQTTATFFDEEGEVLKGTTELLLLGKDGTAVQDIVIDYGHSGESGYRVGIVWDRDNEFGAPVEVINTFVSRPGVATEAYDDALYNSNPNTIHMIGDNEGGRETFPKIFRYSKSAIIAHNDEPNVFSTVTVRNDQDINLFSGNIDSTSNSLNEISETLRAELDVPKKFAPDLPTINKINPIEVKSAVFLPPGSSSADSSSGFSFSRDVQPFETGDLKWVQVSIPIVELEETDGDVRLKDPTKIFGKSESADINDFADDVGDNEVGEIIKAIETNQKAEAGYWYKVFKDYRNRDDELFFYHYKTGEAQESDQDPNSDLDSRPKPSQLESREDQQGEQNEQPKPGLQSDFDNELTPESTHGNPDTGSDSTLELNSPELEQNQIDSSPRPMAKPPELDQNLNPFDDVDEAKSIEDNSLSAGSLMMATLLIQKSRSAKPLGNENGNSKSMPDVNNSDSESQAHGFLRLDRLKRKVKRIFG